MSRSVYSLVLMDDVVREVDRMALALGVSRSAMVNRLLAERVSLATPEQLRTEVLTRVEESLAPEETLQVLVRSPEGPLVLRSVLRARYNPTLRYSVVLYPDGQPFLGELRVTTRAQQGELLVAMNDFFELWARLEQASVAGRLPHPARYQINPGRYRRWLVRSDETWSREQQGEAIAAYIRRLDGMIKLYFTRLDDPAEAIEQVAEAYAKAVRHTDII